MPYILIRDLSQEAVERIDAAAANLGLSRNEYLRRKFEENVMRDRRAARALRAQGWKVITVWECQTANPERLKRFLASRLELSP